MHKSIHKGMRKDNHTNIHRSMHKSIHKAQINTTVVMAIMTFVIMGGVLMFAFKSFASYKQRHAQDQLILLKTELEADLLTIRTGSTEKGYTVPDRINKICFYEPNPTEFNNEPFVKVDTIRCSNQTGLDKLTEYNVFLISDDSRIIPIKIGRLRLNNCKYYCKNISFNTIKLKMQGSGSNVFVS